MPPSEPRSKSPILKAFLKLLLVIIVWITVVSFTLSVLLHKDHDYLHLTGTVSPTMTQWFEEKLAEDHTFEVVSGSVAVFDGKAIFLGSNEVPGLFGLVDVPTPLFMTPSVEMRERLWNMVSEEVLALRELEKAAEKVDNRTPEQMIDDYLYGGS